MPHENQAKKNNNASHHTSQYTHSQCKLMIVDALKASSFDAYVCSTSWLWKVVAIIDNSEPILNWNIFSYILPDNRICILCFLQTWQIIIVFLYLNLRKTNRKQSFLCRTFVDPNSWYFRKKIWTRKKNWNIWRTLFPHFFNRRKI